MGQHGSGWRGAAGCGVLALLLLASGCAEQRIRSDAEGQMRGGRYAEAVQLLEQGTRQHPDSLLLRSALVQARTEAATRLATEASALIAQGRLTEADALLQRARAIDADNPRINDLAQEVAIERRQRTVLEQAEELARKGQRTAALTLIGEALKGNPRYAPLLDLQRRLEMESRQARFQSAQTGLAEKRPVSLDFRDASLRTVLDVVSRNSGINFILDKDIRPDVRVTVYLRSARVEDAIDLIVSTNQLAKKVVDGQTILIYPNTPEKQREYEEQVVRVFYLANAEAKGAASFLRAMLKIREPYVDEHSNMLALRESPDNIQLAERLIALYDTDEPEVLLELEVIEVSSNRLTELGVQIPDTFSLSLIPPGSAKGLTLDNIRNLGRGNVGVKVGDLVVNLKRQVGDVNTLASPRIRVKNREKAKVLVGDKIPVITTTQGTGGFVSESVNYIDVGLKLDVEPTVYADDDVAIKLALEVSSLGNQIKTAAGSIAYQIGTRNATTLLRLHDGQTQLLAGLISRDERTSASRLPGVGDIPVVGRLFSNQADSSQRTELVLAVTPHVLRNVRRLDANEAETWIGTEAMPRLRPQFGRIDAQDGTSVPVASTGVASKETSPASVEPSVRAGAVATRSTLPAMQLPTSDGAVFLIKWDGPAEVKVGDTFELALRVQSQAQLRGMPVHIGFSTDKLKLVQVTEGDFFKQGELPTGMSQSIDESEGTLQLGVLRQQGTGAAGQGTVAVLRFKTLAGGVARVSVVSAAPIGLEGPVAGPSLPVVHRLQVK